MNRLIPHIQYLLISHDCVIVPGWGAFVAEVQTARCQGDEIFPPCRRLAFNSSLDHNDALIADSIMRRENISFTAATKIVADSVAMMKSVYDLTGEIVLPRVGSFVRSASGNMIFSPATENNIADVEFFGLEPVKLPVDRYEEEYSDTSYDDESTPRPLLIAMRRAVRWVAAIIVLFLLGIALSTPIVFDKAKHYQASVVNPSFNLPKTNTAKIPEPQVDQLSGLPLAETAEIQPEEPISQPVAWRKDLNDRYFLIVASFETKRQADKYIAARNDENLDILDYDGRFRVFAATGKSADDARIPMADAEFCALHPDGWVFKK